MQFNLNMLICETGVRNGIYLHPKSLDEVLGYHNLSETDERDLTRLFALTTLHPVSSTVINGAISLRQQRNISVGDAIIAATALLHRQTLVTRNIDDFDWIDGLKVVDPFDGF